MARSVDDLVLAGACAANGWRGACLKSHAEPTGGRAAMAGVATGAGMIGGVVLNRAVGGLNADAIDAFARATPATARIVWMPTRDAAHDIATKGAERAPVPVFEGGEAVPGLADVLAVVAAHDLVLASGHLHPGETVRLFEAAWRAGVRRLLVTHATAPITAMADEDIRRCLDLGAHVELCARNLLGLDGDRQKVDPAKADRMAEVFRLRPDRIVLSSDLGDTRYPLPWEGLALAVAALEDRGIARADLHRALTDTPARLVHHSTA